MGRAHLAEMTAIRRRTWLKAQFSAIGRLMAPFSAPVLKEQRRKA
jgi:hypothetical protein